MATMSSLVTFFAFLYGIAEATSCNFQPVSLPLKDIQVLPDIANSFMRGIPVTIGSPPQDIVVLPWAELNNTWLYDYDSLCDDSVIFSDTICRVRRGNYYFENASTTWEKSTNIITAGGAIVETAGKGAESGISTLISSSLGGSDHISIETANLTDFPIGIPRQAWDHGYTILHAMGMGSNSSFLQRLVDTGQIASRVWSIFWGRMWVDDALDGSVVVGGYDTQKTIGDNYTQALDYSDATGCWTGMAVTISDIQLIARDGNTASIFPTNFALPVCIVPQRQLLIEAPDSIFALFESLTNTETIGLSYGLHWSAQLYNATNFFNGDMSIHLSNGLVITVPNDQFMVPFVTIERNGSRIFDDSQREFLFNVISDQPATLGRYFLTSAYLMVNHDSDTFTLWQANPSSSSELVAVVSESTASDCAGVAGATGVVQPGVSASATATPGPVSESKKLSAGPIAGITVGSVIAVIGVGVLGLYFLRKKKVQSSQSLGTTGILNNGFDSQDAVRNHDNTWYEMEGKGITEGHPLHRVYEMDADSSVQ
ncbi:aspartic peptidase domain-containing protein [Xylariales sp. PMI_506]|nr:aspartic peptidase domain-containing protein [Xylariales sp. PMI_506]